MAEHDVEQVWRDFWVPILDNAFLEHPTTQEISLPLPAYEQIKRELYDFHNVIKDLSVLYDDITGGRASKVNTDKRVIADLVQDRLMEAYDDGYEQGSKDVVERIGEYTGD